MGNSNPFLGINRSPLFPKFLPRLVMNTRILNKGSAWKAAGRRGILRKRGNLIMGRDMKERCEEIKKIGKIERNLMENSGVKN